MFLAWCIMDALRANIMRFYSAIHIKHRKQQKARVEGRSAIKMPAPKHIISTPSSRAHSPRDAPDLRPSTLAAPLSFPGLFFTISKSRIMWKLRCINERYRYVISGYCQCESIGRCKSHRCCLNLIVSGHWQRNFPEVPSSYVPISIYFSSLKHFRSFDTE